MSPLFKRFWRPYLTNIAAFMLLLFGSTEAQSFDTSSDHPREHQALHAKVDIAQRLLDQYDYAGAMAVAVSAWPQERPHNAAGQDASHHFDKAVPHQLRQILYKALLTLREQHVLRGHEGALTQAIFSPDGRQALTLSVDETARLWDVKTGEALAILRSNDGPFVHAAFSPDGQHILTLSHAKTTKLWDAQTGQERDIFGESPILSAVFSPKENKILTISGTSTARLWDVKTGKTLLVLHGHEKPLTSAVFSPRGRKILTASQDQTAQIWDAKTGKNLLVLHSHQGPLTSAIFSPRGRKILTISQDQTAQIWDARKGESPMVLQGHEGPVTDAVFSPDGYRVLTISDDQTLRIWRTEKGKNIAILRDHAGPPTHIVYSYHGQNVLTLAQDHVVSKVLHAPDSPLTRTLLSMEDRHIKIMPKISLWGSKVEMDKRHNVFHTPKVSLTRHMLFPEAPRHHVTSASEKQTHPDLSDKQIAQIWNAKTGVRTALLKGHDGPVTSAVFSPDGKRVLTTAQDHTARLWAAQQGSTLETLPDKAMKRPLSYPPTPVLSPDGHHMLVVSINQSIKLWNAQTSTSLHVLKNPHGDFSHIQFSPDSRLFLTIASDSVARIWDTETGKARAVLQGHRDRVHDAAFSPDGQRIVTASSDETIRVWQTETGQEQMVFYNHRAPVIKALFSADGERILALSRIEHKGKQNKNMSWGTVAHIWDAKTGAEIALLGDRKTPFLQTVFSPDGNRILTTSQDDKDARLWDGKTSLEIAVLGDHEHHARLQTFSEDSRRVLTFSRDRQTIRVWDAQTGQKIRILRDKISFSSAAFSPNAQHVFTTARDGSAKLWDLHTGEIVTSYAARGHFLVNGLFMPNKQQILTLDAEGRLQLWPYYKDDKALLGQAQAIVAKLQPLTSEEKCRYKIASSAACANNNHSR